MRTHQNILRFFSFGVLLCLLVQPAQARVGKLPPLIFVSGIGLSLGSIYLNKSAQDSYDAYLQTAFQHEIQQYRQDYLTYESNLSESAVSLGLLPQVDLAQREANIVWRRRF